MYEPASDSNPRAVAEMCVAGYLAEVGTFRHHLPKSWLGDIKMLGISLRRDAEYETAEAAAASSEYA